MKKLFLLSTFYILFLNSFSQIQFNNAYESEYIPKSQNVFLLEDTGYFTVGGSGINGFEAVSINIFNMYGDFVDSKDYKKDNWNVYNGYENNFFKVEDKYFISGASIKPTGDVYNSTDSSHIYLYVLSESLDSLNTYKYLQDTLSVWVSGMTPTHDKGFLIVGLAFRRDNGALVYENSYDAFMLKVDSSGQEQWYKTFGRNTSELDRDEFNKVVQTPDKGYLCAGYTKSWQTGNMDLNLGDWWIVKTDSMGVEQWSERYGHPDYNDDRPYGLIISSDTSYYVIGCEVQYVIGTNLMNKAKLLKFDKDFNLVYESLYGEVNTVNKFTSITENNEGNIVLNSSFRLHDEFEEYGIVGRMYKLNADGDSIWRRQYTSVDTTNTLNFPFSIKQTTDGGYVFTGIAYDTELSPAQQVWLVKTDEFGCDGTGDFYHNCTNVMVNEYVSNESFEMYPNPARESLTLTLSKGEGKQNPTVKIYNLTGKLVKSFPFGETEKGLNISDLESGIYLVKLGEQIQKLVVE